MKNVSRVTKFRRLLVALLAINLTWGTINDMKMHNVLLICVNASMVIGAAIYELKKRK